MSRPPAPALWVCLVFLSIYDEGQAAVAALGDAAQPGHGRQLRALLRARRERPRDRRAAEQRDELAPLHSITSSARKRTAGGIVSSRDFAVLRFSANSNFVGCSTGKSAGLTPLRTLATMIADCRHIAARPGP